MSCFDQQINQNDLDSPSHQEFPDFQICQPKKSLLALFEVSFFQILLSFKLLHFRRILQKLDPCSDLFQITNYFRSQIELFSSQVFEILQHFQQHHPYLHTFGIKPFTFVDLITYFSYHQVFYFITSNLHLCLIVWLMVRVLKTWQPIHRCQLAVIFSLRSTWINQQRQS